ncbi:flagellin N-terminal helical domain-containing protein [Planococcus alpniumensis]|uniref:flagellin N-terminal helical domain-containing protein n=1 Tax=Planococcus alpniumensis TaxID=2708345 RepID=UPI001B8CE410|nr:flagellin [Planococcus sp. MSAK28401]
MIINHNIAALNTHRQMGSAQSAQMDSMEKLSSGLRINSAKDDAAGLTISEKMRGQIRGLEQGTRNAQDGISMIQTAEGALSETQDILQRMRELSVQSANGTSTDADRTSMQDELNQLTSEINRIGNTTEFNTQKVLNGGIGSNGESKLTLATSAKIIGAETFAAAADNSNISGASIKVDGKTFDVTQALADNATGSIDDVIAALKDSTSGGVKLSDVLNIEKSGTEIVYTSKSQGAASEVKITTSHADEAALLTTANSAGTVTENGVPTTRERHGLEASAALTANDVTLGTTDSLKFTIGNNSEVEVNLNNSGVAKTYDTDNTDTNIAKAAMEDLVKDLNAALQESGMSDKVTASLGADNKLQFISETDKDISVVDGSGTPLTSLGGGLNSIKNVEQVVGAGAEGSGFSTKFQIGANTGQSMSLNVKDMRSAGIGITGNAGQAGFTASNEITNGTNDIKSEAALNISNREDASKSIEVIDKAIASVSSERGKLGAVQNRLEHTINNLGTSSENLTAAESRIRDVDYVEAA